MSIALALLLTAAPTIGEGEVTLQLDLSRYPIRGRVDAPVLVAEFSDFKCPACQKFSLTVMPNLTREFIEPGVVKVMFVDFPMVADASYTTVFESAHCAGKQGRYWEMHDTLWEHVGAFAETELASYASKLSLDMVAFTRCLGSDEYRERVLEGARLGDRLGLSARPTFFIGRRLSGRDATGSSGASYAGRYVVGAHNYVVFKSLIERALPARP